MTARKAAAALLGVSIVLASCSSGDTGGSEAGSASSSAPGRTSDAAPTASSPAGSSTPEGREPRRKPRPASTQGGWAPTPDEWRQARRRAAALPLRDLAGQVIVAHYSGTRPPTRLVNDLHLGGVIVFEGNIASTAALRQSNRTVQASARRAGRPWPVFIGVDQEGGVVERVKGEATRFPSFMSAGAARDPELTTKAAAASGAELVDLGFSVVFAPDGDVTEGPVDPTIASRSAGAGPRLVAHQMNAAVDGYLSAGILPVVKHFPGHGSVSADSHVELPVQTKTLGELRATDLVPFASAAARDVPSVMVAHIDVRAVDPGTPSSISRPVVSGLLRRELRYDGLVVTDAMNMAGVADRYPGTESAVRALQAGNDVVLMPPDPAAARAAIVEAVGQGRLTRGRLEEAAARQIAMLLHQRRAEPAVTAAAGTSGKVSQALSAGAATVVSGPCMGRLVGQGVHASGPDDTVAAFYAAARRAGLRTGEGTSVALIGYGGSGTSADVVVTTDTPYALGESSATIAKIAMYGDTPAAMRALVQVLLGKAPAPGRLPVPVDGVERQGC